MRQMDGPKEALPGKRLRIAVLNRVFKSTGGGAERYSIALVEHLAHRHEIHIYAQEIEHQWPGVTYHRVAYFLRRPRWINQLWFALATWWLTRKNFDVVHSHENTWHGQVQTVHVLPIKFNLFQGLTNWHLISRYIKVLFSIRLLSYLWLEGRRYDVRYGRQIVLTSGSLIPVMNQVYMNTASALNVIPPGVASVPGLASKAQKLAARDKLEIPKQGLCILFVANDYRKKGLSSLIQAMPLLPEDVYLVVVGNTAQIRQFQDVIYSEKLSQRIFLLGTLNNISIAYQAADCLCHPTLEDTFGMVVLEAMSHGLPVVVSAARYCGIAQLLVDGENALILEDPKNVMNLVFTLKRILLDSTYKLQIAHSGYCFAKKHLWTDAAFEQEKIYISVACNNKY